MPGIISHRLIPQNATRLCSATPVLGAVRRGGHRFIDTDDIDLSDPGMFTFF